MLIKIEALKLRGISLESINQNMEENPFSQNDLALIYGPHFGIEASREFQNRLESLGLEFGVDFIDTLDDLPEWCELSIKIKSSKNLSINK